MTSITCFAAVVLISLWACNPAHAADNVAATSGNDYLGSPDGRSFFHDGAWSAAAFDRDADGGVDRVEISDTPSAGFPKPFVFQTDEPGRNINVGTYNVARPYERSRRNLLVFSLSSLPCNPSEEHEAEGSSTGRESSLRKNGSYLDLVPDYRLHRRSLRQSARYGLTPTAP